MPIVTALVVTIIYSSIAVEIDACVCSFMIVLSLLCHRMMLLRPFSQLCSLAAVGRSSWHMCMTLIKTYSIACANYGICDADMSPRLTTTNDKVQVTLMAASLAIQAHAIWRGCGEPARPLSRLAASIRTQRL